MATDTNADHVNRFVESARRLIVIQVIVAVIALIATAVAAYFIWDALKRTDVAEKSEEEATQAAVHYQTLVTLTRPILQAKTDEEYLQAAYAIGDVSDEAYNEDIYALLASAFYKGAPQLDGTDLRRAERYSVLSSASTQAGLAIDKSIERVAKGPEVGGTTPISPRGLYIEFAALQCALANSADPVEQEDGSLVPVDPVADVKGRIGVIKSKITPAVLERLSEADVITTNVMVMRECGSALTPAVLEALGVTTAAPPPVDEFVIKQIYVQIGSEADRQIANYIRDWFDKVPAGPRIPGVEYVKSPTYKPGVRYYHAEQQEKAKVIQDSVIAAAAAVGTQWMGADIPLVALNLDLPERDTIQVWLPVGVTAGAQAPPPVQQAQTQAPLRAGKGEQQQIRVFYYQRQGDEDSVISVLQSQLPKGAYSFERPQISGDTVNMMACHQDLSGDLLAQFKTLASALVENGVPISYVKSYAAPASKPVNRVEILRGGENHPLLTRADIDGMTACPPAGDVVARPE